MDQIIDFFSRLFDISDWPPRWFCGTWTPFHGWLYIGSDISIWLAYSAIPLIGVYFISKRDDIPFQRVYVLFCAFILACGLTHLIDAVIFWKPIYRVSAIVRFMTAVVSWMTVFALIKVIPQLMSLKTVTELQSEIDQRLETEEKLRKSEERFNLAITGSAAGIWDREDLQADHMWWSPRLFELLGYNNGEIEPGARDYAQLIHPDDREEATRLMNSHLQNQTPFRTEYRLRTKDGGHKWFLVTGQAIWDDRGKPVRMVGSVIDINHRKEATRRLIDSEERFDLALKGSSAGVWDWPDMASNNIFWSSKFYELLGYEPGEIEPSVETFEKLIHPDDIDIPREAGYRHMTYGSPFDVEYRVRTKNGDYKWFRGTAQAQWNDAGEPIRMVGSITDITDRKIAEQGTVRNEERFRSIFTNSGTGTAIVNARGYPEMVNEKLCQILGYTADELKQMPFEDFTHPEDRNSDLELFRQLKAGDIDGYNIEKRYITKAGDTIWGYLSVSKIEEEHSELPLFIGVVQDITARKKAETQLKNYTHQLEQKNKELEEFALISAHDMKAPLDSLEGLLGLLEHETDPEQQKHLNQMSSDAVHRMKETMKGLNEVFAFRKTLDDRHELVHLSDALGNVESSLRKMIEDSHAKIVADFSIIDEVELPGAHLISILQNLISNAIKYKKEGIDPLIEIRTQQEEDFVVLNVTDNGMGMDLDKYGNKLFKLFSRFHPNVEGRGIGLHMVYSIVESYGGHIKVDSKLNRGTTFRIYIRKR